MTDFQVGLLAGMGLCIFGALLRIGNAIREVVYELRRR